MSNHEEHHHESPKRVYFGIPIAFALSFWFIVFLSMKACDRPKDCCSKEECSKECMEKCKAEGKECEKKEGVEKEKGGESVLENENPPKTSTIKSKEEETKPDSPGGIQGEKSPVEKSDSAKGH